MVDIWPFYGTRPYTQDAKTLIAPSTDYLSIENIKIFRKNNYWNYLKILNPVGQLKEKDSLLEARTHFNGSFCGSKISMRKKGVKSIGYH